MRTPRGRLYLIGFLNALGSAGVAYVLSTFLSTRFSVGAVGWLYGGAYALSLLSFLWLPRWLPRLNTARLGVWLALLQILALSALGWWSDRPFALVLAVLAYIGAIMLMYPVLDVLLEQQSDDSQTGRIRGAYLSLANLGWLVAPLLAGQVIERWGYERLFQLLPVLFLLVGWMLVRFSQIKSPQPPTPPCILPLAKGGQTGGEVGADSISATGVQLVPVAYSLRAAWRQLFSSVDRRRAFTLSLLLEIFFGFAIIYIPLYLHEGIRLDWRQIGFLFALMNLPFVLFEYAEGWLADKAFGEKEMLLLGFGLMSLSLAVFPLSGTQSLLWWGSVLVLGRIGAALAEELRDSYFFKHVEAHEADVIAMYRTAAPLGYLLVPLGVSLLLPLLGSLQNVFFVVAVVLALGVVVSARLIDTR